MHHIIVDLGFGDSGKGAITDRLASRDPENTVVVRYTGGSQAGHNVVIGNQSHVHSSFASGALGGIRSHMSAFCPINPHNLIREARILESITAFSTLSRGHSVDPLCPLITAPDRAFNRWIASQSGKKNTVGVGVGAAMYRHENSPHRIFAADLLHRDLYLHKLHNIIEWYRERHHFAFDPDAFDYGFPEIADFVRIVPTASIVNDARNIVFEGAQGILLDRDHGFFPDVTYGYTTMRNALELLPRDEQAELHYVSRSYSTRHGDGPMGKGLPLNLPDAHNTNIGLQGEFRTAQLDPQLLGYAFMTNEAYADERIARRVMNVTCIDRHPFNPSDFSLINSKVNVGIGWTGADRSNVPHRVF